MLNFWEQFAIAIVKGLLAGLHVDINRAATLKLVLIGIATDIALLYDLTPPAPSAVTPPASK